MLNHGGRYHMTKLMRTMVAALAVSAEQFHTAWEKRTRCRARKPSPDNKPGDARASLRDKNKGSAFNHRLGRFFPG